MLSTLSSLEILHGNKRIQERTSIALGKSYEVLCEMLCYNRDERGKGHEVSCEILYYNRDERETRKGFNCFYNRFMKYRPRYFHVILNEKVAFPSDHQKNTKTEENPYSLSGIFATKLSTSKSLPATRYQFQSYDSRSHPGFLQDQARSDGGN